jgi:hypothetical protein
MRFLFKLFFLLSVLLILPAVATVALLKWFGTPLINTLLNAYLNAPAKVEKVETDWLLTRLIVEKLQIENPEGFPKGKLLQVDRLALNISPKSYYLFQPYGELKIEKGYFHFIRRSDNATNVAVAFKLPYQKAKVKPLSFEVENLNAQLKVETLERVTYHATGIFKGLGNNSEFEIKGSGNLQTRETVTDFIVYNWRLKDNPLLSQLAELLNQPQLKDISLSKIEGTVKTQGDWLIFTQRDTKAFVTNSVLFAVVYKGSKYNLKTKELDMKLSLYIPIEVTVHVTGTTDSPHVEILNLKTRGEVKEKLENLKEKVIKEFLNPLQKLLPMPR